MRDRLEGQFAGEQAPIVDVKMQLLKRWKKVNGITFDAPIVVVATMDAVPAFGMAFELNGKEIRIRQLQGVRGFSTRGRYHPVRAWPQLFVESCQDLALMHGYSQVLLVRSHRSYGWKHQDRGPDTKVHFTYARPERIGNCPIARFNDRLSGKRTYLRGASR